MLLKLSIKNFVIIEDLEIGFGQGLNILTGETGAGKSILIDALSAVMGERMTTDMIRTGFEKASLEGVFDISNLPEVRRILDDSGIDVDNDTLVLRRELYSSGKGRSFANSVQIPISKMKEISDYLVDIHGQNEHQNIARTSRHREMLDGFGGHQPDVERIRAIHERLADIKNRLASFEIDEREKARRIEYNTFAIREIESAKLAPGEEDELRTESGILANAEKLFREINSAVGLLQGEGGALQRMKKAEQGLARVSEYDPEISGILDSIKESLYSLEDAAGFLKNYERRINYSPERVNQVEERLSLISSLKKKYGDGIQEILAYAEKAGRELEAISSGDEQKEKLNEDFRKTVAEAKKYALELSEKRKNAAKKLEDLVMKELGDLGMGGTVFKVSITRETSPDGEIESDSRKYILYPHGIDKIEFLLSANKGEELRQLSRVASGGEMSRIMLAIKNVIMARDIVESLIFDEVDAGIGGKVAEIVGRKLKSLSKNRQVLVITHLPQIAAMSDNHYSVRKGRIGERITTAVQKLNDREKVREVARMLAGEKITDLSVRHAEEMIQLAGKN
ncbi:MAG: DNA repair protein RecN [Spirochaetes bacterium]|jgi:DNA repair protein RecN (Recombination protein N)|nr:DNA repair protein RecN [Spirochaetota bacterium]